MSITNWLIINENLKNANLNEEWLKSKLNTQGIENLNDVFYAGFGTIPNLRYNISF